MKHNIYIAPSILSSNLLHIGEEIKKIETQGADYIHIDIMDGHFVPNISFGINLIEQIQKITKLPIDIHLMTLKTTQYFESIKKLKINSVIIHPESNKNIKKTLKNINNLNCKAGIALNPNTPLDILNNLINYLDIIIIMTVNPGFSGQKFIKSKINKIKKAKLLIKQSKKNILLGVDGGINSKNASKIIKAGADLLISGDFIFKHKISYHQAIKELKDIS